MIRGRLAGNTGEGVAMGKARGRSRSELNEPVRVLWGCRAALIQRCIAPAVVLAVLAFCASVSSGQDLPQRQPNQLRIHFLNVGAGSCAIVECPGAPPMIVDCGSSGGSNDDLTAEDAADYIGKLLRQNQSRPNVVLSHPDRDHYSYIASSLGKIPVGNIWEGGIQAEYSQYGYPDWMSFEKKSAADVHAGLVPDWHNDGKPIGKKGLSCGDADSYILTANSGKNRNANSLVLMLRYNDFTAVFTGDAEGATETQALRNFNNSIKATVLTMSHHGSETRGSNGKTWADV